MTDKEYDLLYENVAGNNTYPEIIKEIEKIQDDTTAKQSVTQTN